MRSPSAAPRRNITISVLSVGVAAALYETRVVTSWVPSAATPTMPAPARKRRRVQPLRAPGAVLRRELLAHCGGVRAQLLLAAGVGHRTVAGRAGGAGHGASFAGVWRADGGTSVQRRAWCGRVEDQRSEVLPLPLQDRARHRGRGGLAEEGLQRGQVRGRERHAGQALGHGGDGVAAGGRACRRARPPSARRCRPTSRRRGRGACSRAAAACRTSATRSRRRGSRSGRSSRAGSAPSPPVSHCRVGSALVRSVGVRSRTRIVAMRFSAGRRTLAPRDCQNSVERRIVETIGRICVPLVR